MWRNPGDSAARVRAANRGRMDNLQQPQSFYFFDFDDNIMFLDTLILIQNTMTQEVKPVSTAEFATIWPKLGVPGEWQEYALFADSYRYFRDIPADKLGPDDRQHFVKDIMKAVGTRQPNEWQAPSWAFFAHACALQRPVSIITARGHSPETMREGIRVLKDEGWIENEPNYLTVYPVSHDPVRAELGDTNMAYTVPTLKKLAIIKSVEVGLQTYGDDLPHQFGMSDDDPRNLQLIIEAMRDCKLQHDDKRFFVFNTAIHNTVKLEVLPIGEP